MAIYFLVQGKAVHYYNLKFGFFPMVKFLIPSVVLLPMMARFTSLMQYFLFIFIPDRICYSSSLVFWCICIPVLLFSQPLKSLIHSCERLSCVSQTAARIPIIFIENQRQIHGEIHGQGVDGRPDCEF